MNRRLIIIAVVGAVILAMIGGLLAWAVSKQNQTQTPVVTIPKLKKILDEAVISPVGSLDNNGIWYFTPAGHLFRASTDGTGPSEYPLPALRGNLVRVLWPKSGSDFLAISNANQTQSKSFYDSVRKIYINFPSNVAYLDWLPDSQRVLYIWVADDQAHQSLVMANADGTGFTKVTDVFWSDLIVKAAPDGKQALLYRANVLGDTNKIYLVDLTSGVITTVIESGRNTAATWLPSGNKFVYEQSTGSAYPKLALYDLTAKSSQDLNLNTNLNKIVIDASAKWLYGALPKKDGSGDSFVKLDLTTLKQESYIEPADPVRGTNLMLVGNTLYFINSRDGKLYAIE